MNKNKFASIVGALGLSAIALTLGACSPGMDSDVVVTVGGESLTKAELYDKMFNAPVGNGYTFAENIIEQHIIQQILQDKYGDKLTDEAIDKQYEEMIELYGGEEEFKSFLESERLTEDMMRDETKISMLLELAVKDAHPIEDDVLKELYENAVPAGTRVAHILLDDEETANEVLEKVNSGEDFAELVKEYSTDEGSKDTDGQYTLVTGEMIKEFEDAAMKLKRDEVTQKPVKSDFGYHIIKMISEGTKGSIDDERENLENTYYHSLTQSNSYLYEDMVRELVKANADDVSIKESSITDLIDKLTAEPTDRIEFSEPDEGEVIYSSDDEMSDMSNIDLGDFTNVNEDETQYDDPNEEFEEGKIISHSDE